MSYTITLTNGRTLAVLADQTFDKVSTSITLIGKNVNAYGTDVNENFIGLLENFAAPSEPRSPLRGQLWYDTLAGRLMVYSTSSFKPVGGPIVQNSQPGGSVTGDLWVNGLEKLLYFNVNGTFYPASKSYSNESGKTGWLTEQVPVVGNTSSFVSNFYVNDDLIAIATDQQITFGNTSSLITTFNTSTIKPGITLVPGYKIYGTATNALEVTGLSPADYLQKDVDETTTGTLGIINDSGLSVGAYGDLALLVDNGVSVLSNTISDQDFELRYNTPSLGSTATALVVKSASKRMGIFTKTPAATLDVAGDLYVRGNVTIVGTTTNVTTNDLIVKDKNIVLGNVTTATDATADGGGITLKGTSDKTLTWYDVNDSWTSSEHWNIATGKEYRVNGIKVLDGTSLGSAITSAPGLTTLPVLSRLTVSNVTISGSTIETVDNLQDLYLYANTGYINLGGFTQIRGLPDTLDGDARSVAINKGYFDDKLTLATGGTGFRKTYTVTLDISPVWGQSDNNIHAYIKSYLSKMLPISGSNGLQPSDPGYDAAENSYYSIPIGARCNVLCQYTTATVNLQTFLLNLTKSTTTVNKGTGTNNQTVLTDITSSGTVSASAVADIFNPKVNHLVKSFKVMAISTSSGVGTWTFVANIL